MPAPGDQHATSIINPFDEPQRHVSEYTAQEIATLQSRLEKQLGPEYLSARTGPSGQKVHYIAADKCIALANEVFGFNGWSSAIKQIQVDFVEEHPQTLKVSLGLSVIVRVTLRDGTFHEDIGYGHIENCSGKAKAFEKAKKEGTTDALKRALRSFGNVLGNCIYDKDYVKKVTKMKVQPSRSWDEMGLHRHADFAKKEEVVVKPEAGPSGMGSSASGPATLDRMQSGDDAFFDDLLGEFDEADFNIVDDEHPDEVSVPPSEKLTPQMNGNRPQPPVMQPLGRALARSQSAGNPLRPPHTTGQVPPRPQPPNQHQNPAGPRPQHPLQQQQTNQPRPVPNNNGGTTNNHSSTHQTPPQPQGPAAASEGVGFFSARAVKQFSGGGENEEPKLPTAPLAVHAFNPHAESPSIRKTPGIDHTKSKPVARNGQHVAPVERKDADVETGKGPGQPAPAMSAGLGRGGGGGGGNGTGGFVTGNPNGNIGGQQQGPMPSQKGNMINPQMNHARRIGAPMATGSPMSNRSQYRPPTMKRPLPNEGGITAGRPALAEVSVNGAAGQVAPGAAVGGGGDPKRQKMV